MRPSIKLTIVLAIVLMSVRISAQDRGMNPLAGQLRELEVAVARAPGNTDGGAWLQLAILCQNAARYRDSERAYRRSITLLKSGDRARLAEAMDHLGTMYAECGQLANAERVERKALKIREHENDILGIGISHMHLSVLFLGKRELSSAEKEAELAVRLLVLEQAGPASPEDRMGALINQSLVLCARGACATAIPELRRALSIAHTNYTNDSIPVGFTDFLLGYAFWKSGDSNSAGELMSRGTQQLSTKLGWGHPMYVRAMRQYGMFLAQAGHASEAEEIRARIAKFENSPLTIDVQSLMFQ